jgi:hypothetical protein
MAHRSQKAIGITLLLAASLTAQELTFQARRDKLVRDEPGALTLSSSTLKWAGAKSSAEWPLDNIQQLFLSPQRIVVLTYSDRSPWLLGVDHEFDFRLTPGQDVLPAYHALKSKLDRRFVAALSDPDPAPLWELRARLLGTLQGSEGVLKFGPDHIVYETAKPENSRTWRIPEDIANVSSTDPYQLTLTTHERAITHYGSRKDFNFQLKQPLDEKRYTLLWRRLNQETQQ